jgi:hypothetical protein
MLCPSGPSRVVDLRPVTVSADSERQLSKSPHYSDLTGDQLGELGKVDVPAGDDTDDWAFERRVA